MVEKRSCSSIATKSSGFSEPDKPQLWVVAGPNGAGKSTLVSQIALQERSELLERRADFAIETTLTENSTLRLRRAATAADCKITLVSVGLGSALLSGDRVLNGVRSGGHSVPFAAIERRYIATMTKLSIALGIVDRRDVCDDSDRRRRLLSIRYGEKTKFVARNLPRWLVDAVPRVLLDTDRG